MTRLMSWCGWLMPIGFAGGEIPLLKNHSIVGVFTDAWAKKVPARKRCNRREVDAARRGRPVASACERRAAARTSRRRDERSGEPNRARPSRLALQQQTVSLPLETHGLGQLLTVAPRSEDAPESRPCRFMV